MKFSAVVMGAWILWVSADLNLADELDKQFWSQVLANASQPVDGHFVVEIKSNSKTEQGEKELQTTIEYWVRGNDLRVDVQDESGRNLNSQVVLKNKGQEVLSNSDRTNASIVASQSDRGSPMAVRERASWLYFQTLLGRYPFSTLALYEESYKELLELGNATTLASVVEGEERVLNFAHANGRSMRYSFSGASLNPHTIEVLQKDGRVAKRLTTVWKTISTSPRQQIAHSGVFEAFGASGSMFERCEWAHSLAEPFPTTTDPFTWEAMSLTVGKKLIVSDGKDKPSTGGYWNGNEFSSTPLAVDSPNRGPTALWLTLAGLAVGAALLLLKKLVSLKALKT